MKRIATAALLMVSIALLGACGGGDSGTTDNSSTTGGTATSSQTATFKMSQLMQSTMSQAMSGMGGVGAAQTIKELGVFKSGTEASYSCTPNVSGASFTYVCTSSCGGSMSIDYGDLSQMSGSSFTMTVAYDTFSTDCVGNITGKIRLTFGYDQAALEAAAQNANNSCTYSSADGLDACPPATASTSDVNNTLAAYGCALSNNTCSASSAMFSVQEEVLETLTYTMSGCTPPESVVGAGTSMAFYLCGTMFANAECHMVYDATMSFTGSYNGEAMEEAPFTMSCDSPTDLENFTPGS